MSEAGLTSLRVDTGVGKVDLLVRQGDAERTILFLHGIGGRAASFADVMRRWPQGPRLIAWDLPGYGNSTRLPSSSQGAFSYSRALHAVIQSLPAAPQSGRIDLVGQSLGGLIGGLFTATHAECVRRLVLVSPAIGYGTPHEAPLPPALEKRLADFRAEGPAVFAAKRAPRLVFAPETKPDVVAAVERSMATLSEAGHEQAVRVLASGNLMAAAPLIARPVLLVSGSDDVITPIAGTKALLGVLRERPRAPAISERLVEIPRAGHAAYLEAAGAFIDAISDFLTETS